MEASALETFLEAQEQSLRDMLLHVNCNEDIVGYLTKHAAKVSRVAEDAQNAGKNKTIQGLNVDTVRFLFPKPEGASDIQ
jgi:hypothetical protein